MEWIFWTAFVVYCFHIWAMCASGSHEDEIMRRDG